MNWETIDTLITQKRIIQAMQAIREAHGCDLKQAIDVFQDRYTYLRATCPNDFTHTPEEYGRGVSS